MIVIRLLICLLSIATCKAAWGDTACPTVSNNIENLSVSVTGAPSAGQGFYDPTTGGLTFQPVGPGNRAHYFVGVPRALVVGHQYMPWVTLRAYPEALVQEKSNCPILLQNGKPLLTTGNVRVTVAPMVKFPCALISDQKHTILVGIMNPAFNIYQAVYDSETQFLDVQYVNGASLMFVGVPLSLLGSSATIQWNDLAPYQEALMTENTGCPVLLQGVF
jgi:hypothetical protein